MSSYMCEWPTDQHVFIFIFFVLSASSDTWPSQPSCKTLARDGSANSWWEKSSRPKSRTRGCCPTKILSTPCTPTTSGLIPTTSICLTSTLNNNTYINILCIMLTLNHTYTLIFHDLWPFTDFFSLHVASFLNYIFVLINWGRYQVMLLEWFGKQFIQWIVFYL